MGFFDKIKTGLTRTRENIGHAFDSLFVGELDDDFYDELEESREEGELRAPRGAGGGRRPLRLRRGAPDGEPGEEDRGERHARHCWPVQGRPPSRHGRSPA